MEGDTPLKRAWKKDLLDRQKELLSLQETWQKQKDMLETTEESIKRVKKAIERLDAEAEEMTGLHNTRRSASSPPSADRTSGSSTSGKDILCDCETDAFLLTVRKKGPNTGRQFYKCSGQNGTSCNFFLWADENEPQQRASSSSTGDVNNRLSEPQPQHRPETRSSAGHAGEVQCRCGLPAKYLTVQKQGLNNGRQFYGCSKPRDQSCNFFQWADETSGGSGSQSFPDRGAADGLGPVPQPKIGTVPKQKRSAAPETEGGLKQRKAPTCGICGQPGHRRPNCPGRSDRF